MSGNATPITGRQVKFGIGLEEVQGYPVKAQALLELRAGSPRHEFARKFSQALSGRPSGRRKAAKGKFTFNGALTVEVTPEGGFPRLLMGRFPLSSAGAGPSYTHTFANLFGGKTFTLIRQDPVYLKVYPGCRISNLDLKVDKTDTDVMVAVVELTGLDELVFDLVANPGIVATFGMDTAAFDPLPNYTSEMAILTYNSRMACLKQMDVRFNRGIGLHECLDKKNGAAATYEMGSDTQASATAYYAVKDWINQDFGIVNPGNSFAPTANVITAPMTLIFDPPANGAGFVNRMTINFPQADIAGGDEVQGEQEIVQNITVSPLDDATGDGQITLVNSISGATLGATGVGVPLATIPPSQSVWYSGGDVAPAGGSGVAPIVVGGNVTQLDLVASYHADGTAAGLPAGISTQPATDGYFVGYTCHVISGASKGQKAVVTGWTQATRRVALANGITAIAAGDSVAFYK